jgi:hypothetical protein
MLYLQGSWLFNPADTNGVPTFRSRPGEQVMSVTDEYLFRGGFSHGVPKIKHLSLSLGGRAWKGFRYATHSEQAMAFGVRDINLDRSGRHVQFPS